MNQRRIEDARDADLRNSVAALKRAALRARDVARASGTPIVVTRNGVIVHLDPSMPMEDAGHVHDGVAPYGVRR